MRSIAFHALTPFLLIIAAYLTNAPRMLGVPATEICFCEACWSHDEEGGGGDCEETAHIYKFAGQVCGCDKLSCTWNQSCDAATANETYCPVSWTVDDDEFENGECNCVSGWGLYDCCFGLKLTFDQADCSYLNCYFAPPFYCWDLGGGCCKDKNGDGGQTFAGQISTDCTPDPWPTTPSSGSVGGSTGVTSITVKARISVICNDVQQNKSSFYFTMSCTSYSNSCYLSGVMRYVKTKVYCKICTEETQ